MGYVFVSHADEDKPRIAPFLRLLKAAGLKLWIDRGHELGNDFTADSGLRLGDAWPASISRALEEAGCILVFWSALSVDPARRVLHNEANTGLRQDKLVQVTLDRDVHNKLHAVFSELQSEKLFAVNSHEETVFAAARVAKAAYGRISEARRRKLEIAGGVPASLLPYVIDRHPQVDRVCADIALNLRLAASQGPSTRTPSRSAYLALASRSDCPDRLTERMSLVDGPHLCRRLRRPEWQEWDEDLTLRWPTETDAKAVRLKERLATLLERHAGRLDRPRFITSFVAKVRRNEPYFVEAWLDGWNAHFSEAPKSPLIPLLFVDQNGGSWLFGRLRLRRFVNAITVLEGKKNSETSQVRPVLLDAFSPITEDEARTWARQHFANSGIRLQVDHFIQDTFASNSQVITLSDFARKVSGTPWFQDLQPNTIIRNAR